MQSKVNTIVVGSLTKRHDWSKRAASVCLEQLWCPHIAHSPHSSPTNQPTPYPIHISCALQIFNVIKLRDANFAADAAAYKSSTRRQKRQRAKSPKGPQSPSPPYSLKTAKATAASKIALNSPKKKKQLISLPAVPIEQQQQHDEASASSSASCVALREARRKICAYNKLPK